VSRTSLRMHEPTDGHRSGQHHTYTAPNSQRTRCPPAPPVVTTGRPGRRQPTQQTRWRIAGDHQVTKSAACRASTPCRAHPPSSNSRPASVEKQKPGSAATKWADTALQIVTLWFWGSAGRSSGLFHRLAAHIRDTLEPGLFCYVATWCCGTRASFSTEPGRAVRTDGALHGVDARPTASLVSR